LKKYIYIDHENINNLTSLVDIDGKYFIFIGATQKTINADLVLATNRKNVEWIRCSGNGKNALDFHIVYILSIYSIEKDIEHIILSKDTGFDPLLITLNDKKVNAKRVTDLTDINSATRNHPKNEIIEKTIITIKKLNQTNRPKSVKKLESFIKASDKTLDDVMAHEIVEELFRKNLISSTNTSRIKYID
jgi:hypothetical protein